MIEAVIFSAFKMFYIDLSVMSGKRRKKSFNKLCFLPFSMQWSDFVKLGDMDLQPLLRINVEWEMLCAIFHYRVKTENPYLSIFLCCQLALNFTHGDYRQTLRMRDRRWSSHVRNRCAAEVLYVCRVPNLNVSSF